MSLEVPDNAAILAADPAGRPTRITNMRDFENEAALPPPAVHIDCPAGFSHNAPDTHTPYATGKHSLPPTDGETDE